MVDPLSSFFRTPIAQSALSQGLQSLLSSGSQKGTVQQSPDGKRFVLIRGQHLPLNPSSPQWQTGQQVNVRLQNGQIVVEPVLLQSARKTDLPGEASRSIAAILTDMGIQHPQAQLAAQALLQSNIPLDARVIQELAHMLPQLHPESMQALIFLISRRLPISESMLYWFTRILSRRETIGKQALSILQDIEGLQERLQDDPDQKVTPLHQDLGQFQQQFQQQFHSFQRSNPDEIAAESQEAIQAALQSAESVLLGMAPSHASLSETVVRLLSLLYPIRQPFDGHPLQNALQELIVKVEALHESLTAQALQWLPSPDASQTPALFIRIPVWKEGDADDIEILYQKEHYPKTHSEHPSATVDIRVDLSNLGVMNIHIGWRHPTLKIGFDVEREEVQLYLSNHLDEIKAGLQRLGFQVESVNVKQADIPKTLQPHPLPPLPTALSGIDVRG